MEKEVRVWDLLVRIFHWGLVLAFVVAYLSGEEKENLHIYSGYVVLALISFRVLWGMIGTRYARFSNFVCSPQTTIAYIKDLFNGTAKRYLGHSPAGAAMIVALLLSLFVVSYSGLKVYAIEEGAGPLASQSTEIGFVKAAYADDDEHEREAGDRHEDSDEEKFWEEIHEASSNFVLFLVIVHIIGVVISGRLHKENLIKAMFTGKKELR